MGTGSESIVGLVIDAILGGLGLGGLGLRKQLLYIAAEIRFSAGLKLDDVGCHFGT